MYTEYLVWCDNVVGPQLQSVLGGQEMARKKKYVTKPT